MAAAAAEQQNTVQQIDRLEVLYSFPASEHDTYAFAVPEMSEDATARQNAAQFIGASLLEHGRSVEYAAVSSPIESLFEAIHLAAEGDENGRKIVETNARTDVIERTLKTGHVMDPVPLIVTETGKIMQYGQTMDSIQANSLRYASDHPIMSERVKAETRNAFRMEELHKEGWFETHSLVVLSLAEDLPEAGFFTETMSCSIQVTSMQGEGLATESAFVSGIQEPGEPPTDLETAVALGDMLGVDLRDKSKSQILDTPLLVPNELLTNGAIDMVELWDAAAGGTFFGEKRPAEDYVAYRKKCHQRELSFQPKVQQIVEDIIHEAPLIQQPMQAVERLNKISGKHMVEHAIRNDKSIDPRVFGPAAMHVESARIHMAMGNTEQAQVETKQAQLVERSNSCPSGSNLKNGANSENGADTDKYGSRTFSCPHCGHKNYRPVRNQLIPNCQSCTKSVRC